MGRSGDQKGRRTVASRELPDAASQKYASSGSFDSTSLLTSRRAAQDYRRKRVIEERAFNA